jgi:hypothetical protein
MDQAVPTSLIAEEVGKNEEGGESYKINKRGGIIFAKFISIKESV